MTLGDDADGVLEDMLLSDAVCDEASATAFNKRVSRRARARSAARAASAGDRLTSVNTPAGLVTRFRKIAGS